MTGNTGGCATTAVDPDDAALARWRGRDLQTRRANGSAEKTLDQEDSLPASVTSSASERACIFCMTRARWISTVR